MQYSKLHPLQPLVYLSEADRNTLSTLCHQPLPVSEVACRARSVWLPDSDANVSQLADLDT